MKIKIFFPPEIMAVLKKPEGFVFNDDDGLIIVMGDDFQQTANLCESLNSSSEELDLYIDVVKHRTKKGADVDPNGLCIFPEDEQHIPEKTRQIIQGIKNLQYK